MFGMRYPQRSFADVDSNSAAQIRDDALHLIQLGQRALDGLANPEAIALGLALSGAAERVVELAKAWRPLEPGDDCERAAQALRDAVADLLAIEQRADQRSVEQRRAIAR